MSEKKLTLQEIMKLKATRKSITCFKLFYSQDLLSNSPYHCHSILLIVVWRIWFGIFVSIFFLLDIVLITHPNLKTLTSPIENGQDTLCILVPEWTNQISNTFLMRYLGNKLLCHSWELMKNELKSYVIQ